MSTIIVQKLNDTALDYWGNVFEEDAVTQLRLDGSEGGLWSGNFVPPPPRPIFLDENATPDGLTTCDLCAWAWQEGKTFTLDAALEAKGELGWVLTLVIVSLISAVTGAIVMIIVLHFKRRTKNSTMNGAAQPSNRPPINTPNDKTVISPSNYQSRSNSHGVWSWLSRRSETAATQLNSPTHPAENHYTHMDETYNTAGEALYAELERENSPAYQNSAYTDPDTASAPSSAYYSDLSVTTVPERAYEVVGLATLPEWDSKNDECVRRPPRLASISETVSVPSDYV